MSRPTRRHGRHLRSGATAAAVAIAIAAGCGSPASTPRSTARIAATPATSSPLPFPGLPALLFLIESSGDRLGALLVSRPGEPGALSRVGLPPGAWRPGTALGRGGTLLLSEARRVLVGRLEGPLVAPLWTRTLLPGEPLGSGGVGTVPIGPACLPDASLAVVFGDGLTIVPPSGPLRAAVPAGARGDCAMPQAAQLLYETEAFHRLASWDPRSGSVAISASACDGFTVGGGAIACLEGPGGLASTVGVWQRRPIEPARPAFGPLVARLAATSGSSVTDVRLSSDAAWLALTEAEPSAGPSAGPRLRVLQGTPDGYVERTRLALPAGALLVGFVED
ncbi:MAG: hypothetical protein ACXWO2_11755 [Candidatus Limnocylindrales bacterium]